MTNLTTGLTYRFQLFSINQIYQSTAPGILAALVGTIPNPPSKPTYVTSSLAGQSITIAWQAPVNTGGIALTEFDLFIDDGAGVWSAVPTASHTDFALLQYQFTGLTSGSTYQFKI